MIGGAEGARTRARRWARAAATTALVLVAAAAVLGSHFYPSTEAVRVRNSFLVIEDLPAGFDWQPPEVPAGFLQQAGAAPGPIRAAAAAAGPSPSALERTVAMVNRLNPGRRRGEPIQRSTVASYEVIAATGAGYCGDYTQVLNGLAWAAGIPVREWGMSFDGFGGHGHAFNEVYDASLRKWVMIDSFNGFWVRDVRTGVPLSAVEFRDRLREANPLDSVEVVTLGPARFGFRNPATMIEYYRRGVDQFYLWWGNNVFDYDDQPLVRAAGALSRSLEQAAAIATGVHPRIRILPTPGNAGMEAALRATRTRVLALAGLCAALAVALLVELVLWRRAARAAG